MKISAILKGSICVLGLVGVGNFFTAPANAGQASARAAVTVSRADGITQTVSGEVVLPSGLYFKPTSTTDPTLLVTPTFSNPTSGVPSASTEIKSLAFAAGDAIAVPTSGTIQGAIIDILQGDIAGTTTAPTGSTISTTNNAKSIQDAAAIIKAAGGANGFGGLE